MLNILFFFLTLLVRKFLFQFLINKIVNYQHCKPKADYNYGKFVILLVKVEPLFDVGFMYVRVYYVTQNTFYY